ncbi:MAG: EAL domain-containing protein [Sulfurospirillum sp.]
MIDALTNIPSKLSLTESLKNAKFPILFLIDIKGFKSINITYGDETGDLLLRYFAKSLSNFAKEQGILAFRVKDDEFALLKDTSFDLDIVEKNISDLVNFISQQTYDLKKTTIKMETNIGISFDLNNSLKKATLALSLAQKENQPFISYSKFARKLLEEKNSDIGQKVETSIKNDFITPYFQRVINLRGDEIYNEVLIRLTLKNSIQPPKFFLEIAKKRGFYITIVKLLSKKILDTSGVNAVNFSFEDIEEKGLFEYLIQRYKDTNTIFELHSNEKTKTEHLEKKLEKLKSANIRVCLDNVKSPDILSVFQNKSIDFVKVDGDIIRLLSISKEARESCKNILKECDRLECKSIATRINSNASFEESKKMGFDYFQGFFFGKPIQKDKNW